MGTKGLAVLRHEVHGDEQLPHRGDERDLRQLAAPEQAFVVGAEPRVLPDGGERGHPELRAEPSVPVGRQAGAAGLALSGLAQARDGADVRGDGADGAIGLPGPDLVGRGGEREAGEEGEQEPKVHAGSVAARRR